MWADARDAGEVSGAREAPPDPQAVARASPILFAGREAAASPDEDANRLDARLSPPRSRYELQAGHVIPAALVTALNSDLPGRVIAQVTAPVYDSVTGDHLLIPQGSRLIGTYRDGARYGESRILLAWNRLILPNGWSINLENMDASDPSGASGLTDRTDNHLDRLAAAIALSSIITVAANEAEDSQSSGLSQSLGDAAAQQAAQSGARIVDRELAVRPTLRVRAGAPVRVLVARDIVLRRYQQ
jgi:type IV secretion system protein VirB10